MRVSEFSANKLCTAYDVTINYYEYGEFHFEAVVGKFTDKFIGQWREFIALKEMDFKGDAPNIFPGQSVFLKN